VATLCACLQDAAEWNLFLDEPKNAIAESAKIRGKALVSNSLVFRPTAFVSGNEYAWLSQTLLKKRIAVVTRSAAGRWGSPLSYTEFTTEGQMERQSATNRLNFSVCDYTILALRHLSPC
jgi:hypothetical protein